MATLADLKSQPGVEDLPPEVMMAFAAALLYEEKGQTDKAESWLARAIEKEEAAS